MVLSIAKVGERPEEMKSELFMMVRPYTADGCSGEKEGGKQQSALEPAVGDVSPYTTEKASSVSV